MNDLIVCVADSYQEKVLEALLPRVPICSQTRTFTFQIIRNILCDSGSYNDSHEMLRSFITDYSYCLVVLDFEGSGIEFTKSRVEAESDVENLLSINGWRDRNAVIMIEPELENWMWMDNPNVENAIGWTRGESLYTWARSKGYMAQNSFKPDRPKERLFEALRISDTSKSSSIYKRIAAHASYRRCQDPAFIKLINTLKAWFSIEHTDGV